MLRDLEELLLSIQDTESREYMREAVTCYHAGAYRAAVIMAFSATMDSLRRKISSLAISGGPQSIKDLNTEITSLFTAQRPYEKELLDKIGAGNDILDPPDAKKLKSIQGIRNSCGHPSGHRGRAEEARDAIAAGIDIVLAKPLQFGHAHVTEFLRAELQGKPHLFPATWKDEECAQATETLLAAFNPFVYERLISDIGKLVIDQNQDPSTRSNALGFLRGAIRNARPSIVQLTWEKGVSPFIVGDFITEASRLLISARTDGTTESPITRTRIPTVLSSRIESPASAIVIRDWIARNFLQDDEQQIIIDALRRNYLSWGAEAGGMFRTKEYEAVVRTAIITAEELQKTLLWNKFREVLDETVVDSVNHYDYHVQNPAIITIQHMSKDRAAMLSPQLRSRYIYNLARAASRNCAQAKHLASNGLGARSDFLLSLSDPPPTPAELIAIQFHWRHLESLFVRSGAEQSAVSFMTTAIERIRDEARNDEANRPLRIQFIECLCASAITELVALGQSERERPL